MSSLVLERATLSRRQKDIRWTEAEIEPTPMELPKRELAGTYLRGLNQTVLTALLTTLFSAVTGIFAIGSLIVFLQTNASFLHPYLAIFLAFGSAALFAVAVVSILSVKKRIESVVGRALRISSEPYSTS